MIFEGPRWKLVSIDSSIRIDRAVNWACSSSASYMETTEIAPSRALLLWLAALLVTWVSGIEPTWRKVEDSASGFERVNWQRHEADRKVAALQRSIEHERTRLPVLREFEKYYPTVTDRDNARSALYKELLGLREELQKSLSPAAFVMGAVDSAHPCESPIIAKGAQIPSSKNPDIKKKISAMTSVIDRLRNFCEFEERLDQSSEEKQKLRDEREVKSIKAGEMALKKALVDARERAAAMRASSDVNFELFGLKFTAAPLLASSLWSGFAFTWLLATCLESSNARAAVDTTGGATAQHGDRPFRLFSLLALLAWVMQLRVSWVGLRITELQGEMKWRALVAITLCVLVLASAYVVAQTLSNRPAGNTSHEALTIRKKALIAGILLAILAMFFAIWWNPGRILLLAQGAMAAVPLIGVLPLVFIGISWPSRHPRASETPGFARRRAVLLGAGSATALALAGLVWWGRRSRGKGQDVSVVRAFFDRDDQSLSSTQLSKLKPGFYKRSVPRAGAGLVQIHYIGENGRIAPRTHPPKDLVPAQEPVYDWLIDSSESDFPLWGAGAAFERSSETESKPPERYEVVLDSASWSFERAALILLSKQRPKNSSAKRPCELLLNGIYHDILFKQSNGPRKRSVPSYRLYDLAAGLAVRFDQPQVLEELKRRIDQAKYGLIFQSRIQKWDDLSSKWHRRWRSRRTPLRWHCDEMVAVF
jgi:hypothetical protein